MWVWEQWCLWIAHCISLVWFLVLVNDSPTGFFSNFHGLRQGDSLFAFLFVIVMEALGMMISAAVSRGLFSGLSVGTPSNISHLLFANDTLLLCGVDPNHLCNLWSSFLLFEVVSGLKTELNQVGIGSCGKY
jgi:hypothetical protein